MRSTMRVFWESGHCSAPTIDLTQWGLGQNKLGMLSISMVSDDQEHSSLQFTLLDGGIIPEASARALAQDLVDRHLMPSAYIRSIEVTRTTEELTEMRLYHRRMPSADDFGEFALAVGAALCRLIKMDSEKWFMGTKTHTAHYDESGRQVNPFKIFASKCWTRQFA